MTDFDTWRSLIDGKAISGGLTTGVQQIGWADDGNEPEAFGQIGFDADGEQVTNTTAVGFK